MSESVVVHDGIDESKRTWVAITCGAGAVAGVATAVPFVSTFAPSERAKAAGAAGRSGHLRPQAGREEDGRMARPAGLDRAPHAGEIADAVQGHGRTGRPRFQAQPRRTDAALRAQRAPLASSPNCWSWSASARTWAARPATSSRAGAAALAARRLAGRLAVPLPRLHVRPGRPRLQEQAGAGQPARAAAHVPVRHAACCIGEDETRRPETRLPRRRRASRLPLNQNKRTAWLNSR